ncbi:AraC family transcriptional regulator [Sphingobium sp.]|uniref:AraC family transcriptional regulator n=1 Tax=Sphingobium sp. TaxID=1912891 RepID=UPI002E1D783C
MSFEPRSWRGFRAERIVLESDEPYEFRTLGETHYLALHDMRLDDGELHIDGLSPVRRTDLRDTLTYAPRGCTVAGWAKPRRGRNSFTAFYFEPEEAADELHERYTRSNPRPFAYARNANLAATMTKIKDIVSLPDIDSLYAEALCLTAAIEILGVQQPSAPGQLTKAQVDRVSEYVDAHLHEPITLDELAGVAGLSRSHFSRAFKATTGQGPYRFVTNRRIDRARALLALRHGPGIAAIGQAVGFANAGVFRRAFLQSVGMTPQQYRKERC